ARAERRQRAPAQGAGLGAGQQPRGGALPDLRVDSRRAREVRPGRGMKVLFVCTENVARSRAAETLFRELQGGTGRHEVRSVGTASHAARRLTTRDLAWADVVAVMEPRHFDAIRQHWPHHAEKVMVL